MMKKIKFALALTAAPLAAVTPANAQEQSAEEAEIQKEKDLFEQIAKAFDKGDQTPIDADKLKNAETIVAKIIPEGAYAKMFEDVINQMLGPIMSTLPAISNEELAAATGLESEAIAELDETKREKLADMIDPNRQERMDKTFGAFMPALNDAMGKMEPAIRSGMARAYARRFSKEELTGISEFFATKTGAKYASESFFVQTDPEIMQASMKAMPMMMETILGSFANVEEQLKDIPAPKTLTDFDDGQLGELAKLLGVKKKTLVEQQKEMAQLEEAGEADAEADEASDS